jgi:hypothetical protein
VKENEIVGARGYFRSVLSQGKRQSHDIRLGNNPELSRMLFLSVGRRLQCFGRVGHVVKKGCKQLL